MKCKGQETTMARSGTLPENAHYEELKSITDVGKEYSEEHQSDRKILQYDRCVKSFYIRSYSSPNVVKYGPA